MALIVTTEHDKRIAEQQIEQRELQRAQQKAAAGDSKAIKKIKANKDSKFEIGEHEQDLIHVSVLTRTLAADQQSFHEISSVKKIQPRIFDQMIANSAFAAYTDAKVIHDPRPNAPKVYALKPMAAQTTPALGANEADLAHREAALAAREEQINKNQKALEERLAKLEQGNKPALKVQADSPDVGNGPGNLTGQTGQDGDDLPDFNIDNLGDPGKVDQAKETKQKQTGKNAGKQ